MINRKMRQLSSRIKKLQEKHLITQTNSGYTYGKYKEKVEIWTKECEI